MTIDLRILATVIWLGSVYLIQKILDESIGIGTALWCLISTVCYLIFWIIYLIIN